MEGASSTINYFFFPLLGGMQVLLSCDCYDRKQGITWMLNGITNIARLILNQKYSALPCSWQLFSAEEVEMTEFFIQHMPVANKVHVYNNNNNRGDTINAV